jgi:hypothetical protein
MRLFSPNKYTHYKWYDDVLKARQRYQHLSKVFDTFSTLSNERKIINSELEVLDDFFDWLQIN